MDVKNILVFFSLMEKGQGMQICIYTKICMSNIISIFVSAKIYIFNNLSPWRKKKKCFCYRCLDFNSPLGTLIKQYNENGLRKEGVTLRKTLRMLEEVISLYKKVGRQTPSDWVQEHSQRAPQELREFF